MLRPLRESFNGGNGDHSGSYGGSGDGDGVGGGSGRVAA